LTDIDTSALASEMKGGVVGPDDSSYDELRKVYNSMIDHHPVAFARCESAQDVGAAIRFARSNGLDVSVYCGGHGVTGAAVADGGVVLDLRLMNGVEVDPEAKIAQVQGGATWGVIDEATQAHGLAVTGGRYPGTGVGGLALGSGSGWIERKFGLTCDNLLSVEVVTADGEVITASGQENDDLFWGTRGGGGNFGVVTNFEFQLHEVGPTVYGGLLMYPGDMAAGVLRNFRDFMADAPDEVGAGVAMITAPPEEFIPEPVRGQPVVGVVLCYAGDAQEGEGVMKPLTDFGPPALPMVGPMPYLAVQRLIEPGNPPGMRNYWNADFLTGLPDEAIDILCAAHQAKPSPLSDIILLPGGGAVGRVPNDAMAFGQREAPFNLHILSMWPEESMDEACISWTRETGAAMKPFTSGYAYLNFIGEEGEERVVAAFGQETFERLQQLKNRYDPDNVFRLNQNITPSSQGAEPAAV
jgi:FAD binding domain-containing protein/berberine-like enzyme